MSLQFDNVTISFPRFGIVRFHLTRSPWDYLDCDRRRAAKVLRWLRGGTAYCADCDLDQSKPILYRYDDSTAIRNATSGELAESQTAAEADGGAGVIEVDGVDCYVQE